MEVDNSEGHLIGVGYSEGAVVSGISDSAVSLGSVLCYKRHSFFKWKQNRRFSNL